MANADRYTSCTEVREDLSAYYDGEMPAADRERIDAHLRDCADCLRELDALKRVNEVYQQLAPVGAPDGFEEGVRAEAQRGPSTVESPGRPIPRWAGPIVAAAAAALVVIAGVVFLELQQGGAPSGMEIAALDAEDEGDRSVESAPRAPAPAPQAAAGEAWDSFTRSAENGSSTEETPGDAAKKASSEWDDFVGGEASGERMKSQPVPESEATAQSDDEDLSLEFRGRDDERSMRELVASAPPSVPEAGGISEEGASSSADDTDRAAVLGEPPSALPLQRAEALKDEAAESERVQNEAKALLDDRTDQAQAAGEVVRRQRLRSFKVGADGVWYESGYEDQPRIALERDSDMLRELMKQYPDFNWNKIIDRKWRQVFQVEGTWYDLEAAPEPE
jgi:anti-sigma factor (TIGR02949 family)